MVKKVVHLAGRLLKKVNLLKMASVLIAKKQTKKAVTGGWLVLPFINTDLVLLPKRLKVSLLICIPQLLPFNGRSRPTLPTNKKRQGETPHLLCVNLLSNHSQKMKLCCDTNHQNYIKPNQKF